MQGIRTLSWLHARFRSFLSFQTSFRNKAIAGNYKIKRFLFEKMKNGEKRQKKAKIAKKWEKWAFRAKSEQKWVFLKKVRKVKKVSQWEHKTKLLRLDSYILKHGTKRPIAGSDNPPPIGALHNLRTAPMYSTVLLPLFIIFFPGPKN